MRTSLRSRAVLSCVVALLWCLVLPCLARAQADDSPPRLPSGVDPNDWEVYFDWATKHIDKNITDSEAAVVWSSHLRPDRAEPLYMRWIAFWARDIGRFEKYLLDDEKTLRDPHVLEAEEFRERALRRNPFVHQGMIFYLYQQLPGRILDSPANRAWYALGQGDLPRALNLFAAVIAREPERYGYLRFVRASAFVNSGKSDSAAAEITALLAQLRAEDVKSLGNGYQSKELLEYSMGLIELQRGRIAAARAALGRAVVENAAFSPAHAMLGEIALNAHDSTTALLEYGLAAETDSADVESLVGLGRAYQYAKHPREAAAQFRRAVALEPHYAAPYLLLASALEASGDKPGAADAYARFLTHVTHDDYRRADVEHKILALKASL
ncbi:MAG TPA: tetratricopeptide repeat protein [Gemmatimonadaceae bacterium]|nr:tetratricopeptide repeat protein [Gemmatimonadaceae bacterium]